MGFLMELMAYGVLFIYCLGFCGGMMDGISIGFASIRRLQLAYIARHIMKII